MVENGIRGGVFYAIHQYAKGNNKYMKDYGTRKKIFISHVIGYQQLIWMGDVTKVDRWWFQMEKSLA